MKKNNSNNIFHPGIRSSHEWVVVFRLAFRNLKTNAMRTALTILGIVIGIMSVIIVMAGGTGLKKYVMGQVDIFDGRCLWTNISFPLPPNATETDLQFTAARLERAWLDWSDFWQGRW